MDAKCLFFLKGKNIREEEEKKKKSLLQVNALIIAVDAGSKAPLKCKVNWYV